MTPDELSGGPRFDAFCRSYLRHTKGRWAGTPLALEEWERAFWWEALEVDPVSGLRVYQEVGLGLPRKNGKSTMAAAGGLYGLIADNEEEPEVYVGASAKQQAGIVMGQSLRMASRSPRLRPYVRVLKYTIEGTRNGGIMRALASDGATAHGLNPHWSIVDEVHAHKDAELYTALSTGTGAREQPMLNWITSAGVDEDNLLRDLYGQMDEGPGTVEVVSDYLRVYRDRDAGVLIYWYAAPKHADIEDPAVWLGCNPASWRTEPSLRRDYAKLKSKGKTLEWRIYHLNQIEGSEETWLPEGAWARLAFGAPSPDDPWHGLDTSLPVGVGVEKSPTHATAAIVVAQRQADDRLMVRARHFRADPTTKTVNVVAMRETVRALRLRFPVPMVRDPKTKLMLPGPAFAYDPVQFTESAEELAGEGCNMVTFGQTAATMAPASSATYELVADGRLTHDGDPVLAEHVQDTTALLTERGMKVVKGKRRPNSGCVAMVMAVAVALPEAPTPRVRKPRVARGF